MASNVFGTDAAEAFLYPVSATFLCYHCLVSISCTVYLLLVLLINKPAVFSKLLLSKLHELFKTERSVSGTITACFHHEITSIELVTVN